MHVHIKRLTAIMVIGSKKKKEKKGENRGAYVSVTVSLRLSANKPDCKLKAWLAQCSGHAHAQTHIHALAGATSSAATANHHGNRLPL